MAHEMDSAASKYGVLVCVDGSASSDAAVAWGTREAIMRRLPVTLMHAVAPVVVGVPVSVFPPDELPSSLPQAARKAAAAPEVAASCSARRRESRWAANFPQ